MKLKLLIILVCLFFLPSSGYAERERYELETIDRIISGDTFQLKSGKKIRLIGVDAPEIELNRKAKEKGNKIGKSAEDIVKMGQEMLAWITPRLKGKKIFLKYDVQKKDDRGAEWVYAYLYDVSGFYGGIIERDQYDDVKFEWNAAPERGAYIFINGTIIKGGYATPIRNPPNLKNAQRFEKLFWEAKEGNEGLWNVDFFEAPCTEEGEKIGVCAGCIVRCCKGLRPIFDQMVDGECRELPAPGTGGYCSNCGNKKCESDHLEDACNCPEDCK